MKTIKDFNRLRGEEKDAVLNMEKLSSKAEQLPKKCIG